MKADGGQRMEANGGCGRDGECGEEVRVKGAAYEKLCADKKSWNFVLITPRCFLY